MKIFTNVYWHSVSPLWKTVYLLPIYYINFFFCFLIFIDKKVTAFQISLRYTKGNKRHPQLLATVLNVWTKGHTGRCGCPTPSALLSHTLSNFIQGFLQPHQHPRDQLTQWKWTHIRGGWAYLTGEEKVQAPSKDRSVLQCHLSRSQVAP